MRELCNYIIEKLDINKVNLNSNFNFNDFDNMLKSLKFSGFIEIKDPIKNWEDVFKVFNKRNTKCFIANKYKNNSSGIKYSYKIANMSRGKISSNNPLLLCNIYTDGNLELKVYYDTNDDIEVNLNDFKNQLYRCFKR